MKQSVRLLSISFLMALSTLAVADKKPVTEEIEQAPIGIRGVLSHSGYTSSTRLFFKVDYVVAADRPSVRPPLNIALVLYASGSMAQDQKIKYTIAAARAVIENLTEADVISLIAFNDKVTVLSPAGYAVNKAFLYHRLEEVFPESYTDISAGLLEGIAQVKSQSADGQIRHVLLLTDGMANRGIIDRTAMRQIAANAHADGIGVSTLGCGSEFNEQHLADLAEAGGGRYTYIKSPEEIPTAFQEELRGLLAVTAQNMRLEIAASIGMITRVNGQPLDKPVPSQSFYIGNVRAGERGFFVVELKPSAFAQGSAIAVTGRVTFDDPQSAQRMSREVRAQAFFAAAGDVHENGDVVVYSEVLDALVAAEEAAKGLDIERYKQAQASFDAVYEHAHSFAVETKDQELLNQTFLLKHFMEEFTAAQKQGLLHSHREARAKFEKESDYRRYLLQHHQQSTFSNSAHH